jgi:hypothetical protein
MKKPVLLHREPPGKFEKACYALFAVSVVLAGISVARLVTAAPLPDAAPPAPEVATPTLGERVTSGPAAIAEVVASDPFHPARTAPAARYILPEETAVAAASGPGPIRDGAVRLLGTVVSGSGGGFVMCQVGSATPQVVRIGEEVADLTLVSITRGEAEFERRDGSTVTLSVPSARQAEASRR